jgi:hypothetical protein
MDKEGNSNPPFKLINSIFEEIFGVEKIKAK